jgi:class 3 adenylate cyclase
MDGRAPASARVKRKLTVILTADVVGYTRLMAEDDVDTLRTLTACQQAIRNIIERHGGRAARPRRCRRGLYDNLEVPLSLPDVGCRSVATPGCSVFTGCASAASPHHERALPVFEAPTPPNPTPTATPPPATPTPGPTASATPTPSASPDPGPDADGDSFPGHHADSGGFSHGDDGSDDSGCDSPEAPNPSRPVWFTPRAICRPADHIGVQVDFDCG